MDDSNCPRNPPSISYEIILHIMLLLFSLPCSQYRTMQFSHISGTPALSWYLLCWVGTNVKCLAQNLCYMPLIFLCSMDCTFSIYVPLSTLSWMPCTVWRQAGRGGVGMTFQGWGLVTWLGRPGAILHSDCLVLRPRAQEWVRRFPKRKCKTAIWPSLVTFVSKDTVQFTDWGMRHVDSGSVSKLVTLWLPLIIFTWLWPLGHCQHWSRAGPRQTHSPGLLPNLHTHINRHSHTLMSRISAL